MIKTVTLTANTEQAVKIEGGTYCSIENRGEGVVYASKYPNVSALADNVVAIDPGNNKILENATKKSNNGTMQGTIYLITDQEGTVEIRTATTVNPFKIKRKGGDKNTSKNEFNIHYGDTAPEDTSKLWVKCDKPDKIIVSPHVYKPTECNSIGTLPVKRAWLNVGVVGTDAYLIGGCYEDDDYDKIPDNTILKFDLLTETMTTLSTESLGILMGFGMGTVGTNIYMFGGGANLSSFGISGIIAGNTIYKFDTLTETVTALSTVLPVKLMDMGVGVVGTDIYLFGGNDTSSLRNTIYKFDTLTETITALSTVLPVRLRGMGVGVVGTDIYLFGGSLGGSYGNVKRHDGIYKFDTLTETITKLNATLPAVNCRMGVAAIKSYIYLFGGQDAALWIYDPSNKGWYNTILKFDALTETITTLPQTINSSHGSASMGICATGFNIYVFGGNDGISGSNIIKSIYKFIAGTELQHNSLLIDNNLDTNLFNVISGDTTIEIGVNDVYRGDELDFAQEVEAYLYQDGAWTLIE